LPGGKNVSPPAPGGAEKKKRKGRQKRKNKGFHTAKGGWEKKKSPRTWRRKGQAGTSKGERTGLKKKSSIPLKKFKM